MILFFGIIFSLYFLTHLCLFFGLRNSLRLKKGACDQFPYVSVIVAAKNEEDKILRCINSLKNLDYKKERLEIFLVNDNSSDRTKEIMTNATEGLKCFKVIDSRKTEVGNLKGKANAIDTAIELSNGEIIFTTDADCEVQSDWINETIGYYDDDAGMVCGFTMLRHDHSLFEKLQAIDWIYLLSLASSSSGFGKTMSCVGNNLSFRKVAYIETGGYSAINFSVTEDMAFMRKVNDESNFNVKYPLNEKCEVKSRACKNLKELFSQKRRWFRGGIGINALGYWMGILLYSTNFFIVFGLLFVNFYLYLILVLLKILTEYLLIYKPMKVFKIQSLIFYYPLFTIYFAFYGILLPLTMILAPKIKWKGRKF